VISLAGYRYRNILESEGGPVGRLSHREFSVYGRPLFQANAWLADRIAGRRVKYVVYGNADGTGTADTPMVARHMAISEAMERWAYRAKVHAPDRELYGFDIDESSNGMAAFPGLFGTEARRRALLEAVERSSVIAWWEGLIDGEVRTTEWPGIQALVLPSLIDLGVTVVAFRETRPDCFAYGQGAAMTYFGACERAVMELARTEYALGLRRVSEGLAEEPEPTDLFERRCLFFSRPEGHAMFVERLHRKMPSATFKSAIVCDAEVEGPWSEFAAVWRVLVRVPNTYFLVDSEKYFFW
jgi:hypothetical protein